MSSGTANNLNNTIPQYNPNQFGTIGLANSGYFNGLGAYPLGGFGATGGNTDGNFDSLLSSLNSSGTFGPGLFNNFGPAGTNPNAISIATEASSSATSALLNKISPLDLPPESLYSSSVFGGLSSGMSFLDSLSTMSQGIAGLFGTSSDFARYAYSVGPVLGAISGVVGITQGLRAVFNTPIAQPRSSQDAVRDYFAPEEPLEA
ncbi:MAG: hypothetical protein QNJ31_01225 [Candidatus Caenarcaniphilales bacterium]|nr:hypothetical protein [Candidatus Caenarcaniphilales bacterium]